MTKRREQEEIEVEAALQRESQGTGRDETGVSGKQHRFEILCTETKYYTAMIESSLSREQIQERLNCNGLSVLDGADWDDGVYASGVSYTVIEDDISEDLYNGLSAF